MVKYTQTIHLQIADELIECVRPFYELDAKRVNEVLNVIPLFFCIAYWIYLVKVTHRLLYIWFLYVPHQF